jgi:hypothetical protein
MNGKCIRHTSIRRLGAKVPLLCSQPAFYSIISLIMDISSILLRSSLRSPTKIRLETKVGDTEEDRHHQTSQHQRARRYLGITFYQFSHFLGNGLRSFFLLHYISAISGGVLTVWSTHIDLGFLCSGLGRRLLGSYLSRSRSLFSLSFLLFIFGFRLEIYITRSMMCAFERRVGRVRE